MGVLDFLFGKKAKQQDEQIQEVDPIEQPEPSRVEEPIAQPEPYKDSYDTGVGLTLRQILVLNWWGRTKNRRNIKTDPPGYFTKKYRMDAMEETDKLVSGGWLLVDKKGMVTLSDEAKQIVDDWAGLWIIHTDNVGPDTIDELFRTAPQGKEGVAYVLEEMTTARYADDPHGTERRQADAATAAGDLKTAIKLYEQIIKDDLYEEPDAYMALTGIYKEAGDIKKEKRVMRRFLRVEKNVAKAEGWEWDADDESWLGEQFKDRLKEIKEIEAAEK